MYNIIYICILHERIIILLKNTIIIVIIFLNFIVNFLQNLYV